jgi:FkbM family methyltransferase
VKAPSRYELKKAVLRPRTAWRRRRTPDADPYIRAALEAHYYRKPMWDFIHATAAQPDILVAFEVPAGGDVVDVGAYDGSWCEQVLDRNPGARAWAFEPDPTAQNRLRRRLGDRDDAQILRFGLTDRDRTATLTLEGPGSSIYADGAAGTFGSAEIELRRAADVFAELGIDEVALLKVNIEGGEFDLFDHLIATGWLERCDQLLIQFHEWHPRARPRRRRIRRALAATHDEVWNYDFMWERWQRRADAR